MGSAASKRFFVGRCVFAAESFAFTVHLYHDELTGLPNRRLLRDRLNQMAQGARQHKQVVLLLLDLDGLETINDQLGHAAGDKVLQAVAERLSASIRAADTACRYGGDEFVIMLPEVDQPGLAGAVAAKVRARLSEGAITSYRRRT